ncbi:MAG: hypothetical protein RLQ25_08225 [Alphaproteobacteria bacterium]
MSVDDATLKYPFSAPAAKIRRALRHLSELQQCINEHLASNPVEWKSEITEVDGRRAFAFQMHSEALPSDLGLIVGDVIHNLRAALDLAACELVRANGESDANVYFPFCRNADELDTIIRSRNFHRAGPNAVALLADLKPYADGNTALRAIHDLDIQDKHQALIPSVSTISGPVLRMWDDDGTINPTFIGDPNAPSEIQIIFPYDSVFAGQAIAPTLHKLAQLADSIIEGFRAVANR